MSRKFSNQDRETFKQVFLQFAFLPPPHLAQLMRVMADADVLPDKWSDFSWQTASAWISKGAWRDQVDRLRQIVDNDVALPSDDDIDDLVMRRNLQMFDVLTARIVSDAGDTRYNMRQYIDLQAQIRTHVQIRRALPLTPGMIIELLVQAGIVAAGKSFKADVAKNFLWEKFAEARRAVPLEIASATPAAA